MKKLKHMKLFESFEWEEDLDGIVDMLHAGLINHSQYSTAVRDIIVKQGYDLGGLISLEHKVKLEPPMLQDLVADAVNTEEVAAIRTNPNTKMHNVTTGQKYSVIELYSNGELTDKLAAEDMTDSEAIIEAIKMLKERGFRYVYVRTGYHQLNAYVLDTTSGQRAMMSLYSAIADIDVKMGIKV